MLTQNLLFTGDKRLLRYEKILPRQFVGLISWIQNA